MATQVHEEVEERAVAVIEPQDDLMPIASPETAARVMAQYQSLCEAILKPEDFQSIGSRAFKKKSAFRKLGKFYGLSVEEIVGTEQRVMLDETANHYAIQVSYRAVSRSGQSATGDGACDNWEKGSQEKPASYHVTRANAHTRAFNRAVSNLVAMGEVSAEEMNGREDHAEPQSATTSQRQTSVNSKTQGKTISIAQGKRLWAIAHGSNCADSLVPYVKSQGYNDVNAIPLSDYERICSVVEEGLPE